MPSRLQSAGIGALIVIVSLATSCAADGGGTGRPQSSPRSESTNPSRTPCPAGAAVEKWPVVVPQQLPVPPGLKVTGTRREGTSQVIRFKTVQSIEEASAFLAQRLPAAGFTLHGGDSEQKEVDQPFTGHDRRGTFKLRDAGPCLLQGVLVISPLG